MNTDGNSMTEAQIRKAIRKAFQRLFKNMANWPTLVIEPGEDEESISPQSMDDIREWLFRGR